MSNHNAEAGHPAETDTREAIQHLVPCEVYSRIVGYLRPVQNWHPGKQQEFRERTPFRVLETSPDADLHLLTQSPAEECEQTCESQRVDPHFAD